MAVALAVLAGGLLVWLDGDAFPDPPESYATLRIDGVELRHPPGWKVERLARPAGAGEDTRVRVLARIAPAGSNPDLPGPVIELRRLEPGRAGLGRADEITRGLVLGRRFEANSYDLDVPGASSTDTMTYWSTGPSRGPRYRLSSVRAATPGGVVSLNVRAPEEQRDIDVLAVAGSLEITG